MLKKVFGFLKNLILEFSKNELVFISYELTYKMLIATFPLLIFVVNLLIALNINFSVLLEKISGTIPDQALTIITNFMIFVQSSKTGGDSKNIMSFALLITIWSASSGFYSVIRGINKAYGIEDKRFILFKYLYSILFVFQFAIMIILTAVSLVFGNVILNFLNRINIIHFQISGIYSFLAYFISILLVLLNVMLIYKIATAKKISFLSTLPGSIVAVVFWIVSSKCFNIYVNKFSTYSNVYGSVGSMFIFIFWINIIALVLLLGGQINALIQFKEIKNN